MSSAIDISAHLDEREKLIKQDRALRVDAAKSGVLTSTESAADEIVRAMRAREAVSVWGVEQEGIENPFPGMEFLTSKAVIMKTKVFDILHKVRVFGLASRLRPHRAIVVWAGVWVRVWRWQMPKGALLHAHLDATVDVNFLLNRVLEQEALYVRASGPLTTLFPTANVLPEFTPFPKSEVKLSAGQSLTDPSYDGGWIPVNVARESFSLELGGPGGFDKWFVASTTINPAEAYGTHNTVAKVSLVPRLIRRAFVAAGFS